MLASTITHKGPIEEFNKTSTDPIMSDLKYDVALIRRIACKDETALQEIYASYGQRLVSYAIRLCGDADLAEDIVQETLVAVWNSAGKYRGEGRAIAWMLRIVHHTTMKALRNQKSILSNKLEEFIPSSKPGPEEEIQTKEKTQWIQKGLQNLSPEHQAVLELVFYQRMSLEEVSKICDVPIGTVKSRLSYARQHLRGILNRMEDER